MALGWTWDDGGRRNDNDDRSWDDGGGVRQSLDDSGGVSGHRVCCWSFCSEVVVAFSCGTLVLSLIALFYFEATVGQTGFELSTVVSLVTSQLSE